jgi:adenylate kinase family enzyme
MPTQKPNIVQRRVQFTALEHMLDDPVVLLEGPRSVGKSTLLREIASKRGGRILDLDDMATLDAVRADPATLIAGGDLVCIDEYQKAPIVLEAIKSELNKDSRPGRFVLTGSARHKSLPAAAQALTGRLDRLSVLPLSQGEIAGIHEDWLERFLERFCAEPLVRQLRVAHTRARRASVVGHSTWRTSPGNAWAVGGPKCPSSQHWPSLHGSRIGSDNGGQLCFASGARLHSVQAWRVGQNAQLEERASTKNPRNRFSGRRPSYAAHPRKISQTRGFSAHRTWARLGNIRCW